MKKSVKIVFAVLMFLILFGIAMLITFMPYKGTKSATYWTPNMRYTDDSYAVTQKVYKDYGKDFKIMQFTDVQLDYDPSAMKGAKELVKISIESNRPDLIVFTGDTVMGPLGHYQLKKFVKFIDGFKIPYLVAMGNHEQDSVADMDYMAEIWESGEYSLFQKGPWNIHGYGNYFVNIVEKQPDNTEKIVYILSCLDTGAYMSYATDEGGKVISNDNPAGVTLDVYNHGYDVLYPDQIAYYSWQVAEISRYEEALVPSMVFTHIPVPEFENAWEQWAGKNADYDPLKGNPDYKENITIPKEDGYGRRYEDVASGMLNSGFFDIAKALGSATHIFAGHDHINNYSILYEGIRLTYGQKTGKCSYSRDDMQGHTVITVGSNIGESGFYGVNVASYHYDGSSFSKVV